MHGLAADDPVDWTGKKKVSLALQGGGSHGAFTWGVLDYLLEDARLDIEAITGTSAGAMNAVVLAEGYLEGGREQVPRQILAIDQRRGRVFPRRAEVPRYVF
jgi:predicted acylesterase/phospholipase RssA